MIKVWSIAAITLREGIRNRAMQGILAIAILLCMIYLTIVPMFAFDTGKVAVDLGFASMNIAGLTIVIFLGIALLARDIHQRSVCMIISRPVSRTAYVLGKYWGLAMTTLIAVLSISSLALGTSYLGVWLIPEMTAPRNFTLLSLFIGVAYQYIALLILMAVAFLFTVLTTNEYLSMLFTLGVYLIGNSLETIVKVLIVGEFAKVSTVYLKFLKFLTWIFPNFRAFDLKVYISYGLEMPIADTFWTAVYGLIYIALLLTVTIGIFQHKEIR